MPKSENREEVMDTLKTPEKVYIDPYENRTYCGTWHSIPPEGGQSIEYVPASSLQEAVELLESVNDALKTHFTGRLPVWHVNLTRDITAFLERMKP